VVVVEDAASGRAARCITVQDIEDLARQAAASLSHLPPERPLLLRGSQGSKFLASLLACWRMRLTPVLADPTSLQHAAADLALEFSCGGIAEIGGGGSTGSAWFTCRATGHSADAQATRLPQDTGVLKLTSGSSGRPRAVLVSASQLAADDLALTRCMGLDRSDRTLASIPLNHSYGLASVALPVLARGTCIVVPAAGNPFAPFAAARDHQVTFLPTTPAYLAALVNAQRPPPLPESLRLLIAAGATLSPATARAFRMRYEIPVHSFYGSSETGGITFDREGGAAERGTVGEAIDGVKIELRPEPDRGVPGGSFREAHSGIEPPCDWGRVVVCSAAVSSGYYPERSPSLEGGCFHTNDLACWLGGELQLLGRSDRELNIRGKKIDPAEIEDLALAFDGVDEAAVLQTSTLDESTSMLRLVVAARPEAGVSTGALRQFLRQQLPPFKRPRSVLVVQELPLNPRGKVDFEAMRRPEFR
jgi:acyl-CoA synthetase (AMP-forming)/AMP-acid ligase II